MKSLMAGLAACLLLAALAVPAFAQGISGSAHDFSDGLDRYGNPADAWNTTGELCVVCHTPHNGTIVTGAPLWNHQTTTEGDFNLYFSTSLTASMEQPSGQSLLCLSCHDGTIAVDNFNGATTGTQTIDLIDAGVGDPTLISKDLADDHPVSFDYLTALPDPELHAVVDIVDTNGQPMLFTSGAQERLECASCHDVHNNGDAAALHLLRVDNTGSQLCFRCHAK